MILDPNVSQGGRNQGEATNAMQCCNPIRSPFILHTAIAPVRSYGTDQFAIISAAFTYLSNSTVFVSRIMHPYQMHEKTLPVFPVVDVKEISGDYRSRDPRVTSFGKPLFEITADAVHGLDLIIRHESLFPTARTHDL